MINISFSVDSVDYDKLIDLLLPKLSEFAASSSDPKLRVMASMPTSLAAAMLKALSEDKKEELCADILRGNKEKLAALLENEAVRQGVRVRISNVSVNRS